MQEFELVSVDSGAKSVRSMEFGQVFHPGAGPMEEARALYVVQQRLAERAAACADEFVIWDVGLGAAANAIAAIEALSQCGARIRIHSFDRTTASAEFALRHADELGYVAPHQKSLLELVSSGRTVIGGEKRHIEWLLHIGDFCEVAKREGNEPPHAIFYDPYSPAVNSEMWTLEHFSSLRRGLSGERPCLWANYTRSTAVRVTLLLAGFYVGEGCGIGEKEMTTVASNVPGLMERAFDARWLERVARSTNSAPLRAGAFSPGPISMEDFERLKACPQFSGGNGQMAAVAREG